MNEREEGERDGQGRRGLFEGERPATGTGPEDRSADNLNSANRRRLIRSNRVAANSNSCHRCWLYREDE